MLRAVAKAVRAQRWVLHWVVFIRVFLFVHENVFLRSLALCGDFFFSCHCFFSFSCFSAFVSRCHFFMFSFFPLPSFSPLGTCSFCECGCRFPSVSLSVGLFHFLGAYAVSIYLWNVCGFSMCCSSFLRAASLVVFSVPQKRWALWFSFPWSRVFSVH